MRRTFLVLVTIPVLAVLSSPAPAQLTPFYWATRGLLGGAQCSVCVIDDAGNQIAGFQVPAFTAPVAAKHMLGVVWVLNGTTNTLVPHTLAGPIVTLPIPAGTGMSVAPNGDLWIQSGILFTPFTLERRNAFGALLFSATPTTLAPVPIRVDPAGAVWTADTVAAQVEKIDPFGVSLGTFPLPITSQPIALETAPDGSVWVLARDMSGMGGDLVKLDNAGNVQLTIGYSGIQDFDLDVCGRPHVISIQPGGARIIDVLDPGSGQVARSLTVPPGIPDLTEVKLATSGAMWLSSPAGAILVPVSRDGVFGAPLPLPGFMGPSAAGDPTGVHLVSVIDPLGDGDADGISNRDEIASGSDPLDPTSRPATLLLSGTAAPGATFSLSAALPGQVGRPYLFAIAGNPGLLPVGTLGCLEIPLDVDPVLAWWLGPGSSLATGWFGTVGVTSGASMTVTLPAGPSLAGFSVVSILVTGDPQTAEIATVSLPLTIPLQ